MDTLLKETVDATVNSRYPGMAPEGRKLIEDILIRKELEKGELLFKEGQVCHHHSATSDKFALLPLH